MPQNVRIPAGYSDKASENYQSRQYSISLELDVAVNGSTREIETLPTACSTCAVVSSKNRRAFRSTICWTGPNRRSCRPQVTPQPGTTAATVAPLTATAQPSVPPARSNSASSITSARRPASRKSGMAAADA